ncbi:WhiB family transcriptional regulator [Streptomyces sp. NPDC059176]|uniref:WhiB family transcriptional regulator n=1 Tax=Streptomyces sp. NPDC059176 TaxID=3346758 RepID=UPI0036751436
MSHYSPDTLEPADTWRKQAACLDADTRLFHPRGYDGRYMPIVSAAQAICDRCPVAAQCLDFALRSEGKAHGALRHGIYGDTTPNDRLQISRGTGSRKRAKCGTRSGYKAHHRLGTPVCGDCRKANSAYVAARIHDIDKTRGAAAA